MDQENRLGGEELRWVYKIRVYRCILCHWAAPSTVSILGGPALLPAESCQDLAIPPAPVCNGCVMVWETVLAVGDGPAGEVQHLACTVYAQALADVPAMVRMWWGSQDRRTAELVDKFTTKFVTPIQVASEMAAIRQEQLLLDNMAVVVRPAARQVAATYSIDDTTIELVVTLPVNHPLGVISVETGRRVGVSNSQWRNWMLQMVTFLSHQNGSIVEGIMLWKRNVDKRFEGVDDCMICFSVIHGTNYQLPRLVCRVCKKRFHSACLYKWFSTSNNSSCPLCRSLF